MTRLLVVWLALLLLGGCTWLGLGGMKVESVGLSVDKPSNVAVYVWAQEGDEPLTELALGNFTIHENGQQLDPNEIDLVLLDRSVAVEHHTLLLVDMGVDDEAIRSAIARGVPGFVQKVRQTQGVTVYAFDGSKSPTLIGQFPMEEGSIEPAQLPKLESFKPRDTSRDLHGALIEALKQLDARLMRAQKPLRVGTLAVFTRGPDLAGRVTADEVETQLDESEHQIFALGVGEDGNDGVDEIGRDGVVRAHRVDTVGIGFEDLATRVTAALRRHYLLSYCSPARAGMRDLRIEVTAVDSEGSNIEGDVSLEFDAKGFGPGCDSRATPRFVAQKKAEGSGGMPTVEGSVSVGTSDPAAGEDQPAADSDDAVEAEGEGEGEEIAPPPARPGYAPE